MTFKLCKSNHLGSFSLKTAQFQRTPSFPMESSILFSELGGLSGMRIIGDLGIEDNPIRILLPSLSNIQNLPGKEGRGRASKALDLSSDLILFQPNSVRCRYAPLLPATRSLETSPSFLSFLNSAEA